MLNINKIAYYSYDFFFSLVFVSNIHITPHSFAEQKKNPNYATVAICTYQPD